MNTLLYTCKFADLLICDFWMQIPNMTISKWVLAKTDLDCFENVKWEAQFRLILKVKSSGHSKVD